MSTLLFFLTFGVCFATIASNECDIMSFAPSVPFGFAQQIFWDNRTNSIFFADAGAASGSDSLYRFDWNSRKLYGAKLTNSDDKSPVSFIIPAETSPGILIAGQIQSVLRVQWNGVSPQAKLLDVVASRSLLDKNNIDRGGTSPDGTLFMSIIPSTYCNKKCHCAGECHCGECHCDKDYPESSIVYLDSDAEFRSALKPGSYTNGIYFDSKTDTCYIADDCAATVYATKWNRRSNALENARPVFVFPTEDATTNYPSGLAVDQCSNFYVGDHNSGLVYYVNSKSGEIIEEYEIPGTHVTSIGFVGENLDYLCVVTGTEYHDSYGGSRSSSTDPGDGKMHLIPISSKCCNNGCKGRPGVPACGY